MNKFLISLLAVSGMHTAAMADDGLTGSVKTGIEYNSNLSVEELDLSSTSGGFLANFDASLGWRQALSKSTSLSVSYDFSASKHFEETEFDFTSHGFSAGIEQSMGNVIFSTDYSYFDTKLAGEGLLDMHVLTPSLAMLVNSNLYVQADYTWYDKNFDLFDQRSAEQSKYGLTAFWFFNKAKSYWKVTYHRFDENAVLDTLDYSGNKITAGVKLPTPILGDKAVFKGSVGWSDRAYDVVLPSLGEAREEERWMLSSSLEFPLVGDLNMAVEWDFIDRSSNYSLADYKENRMGVSLSYKF